jgi:hypothetical protein
MNQENSEQRIYDTVAKIDSINAVEGFDPMTLAIKIGDLNEGGARYHLPVMAQIAWFRLKYPEGKIATTVKPGNNCFIADARVYANYKDPADFYLAEGSAARGICKEKSSVSPREWAQTAAIGIALRNAGFGLQASIAGESFEDNAIYELLGLVSQENRAAGNGITPSAKGKAGYTAEQPEICEIGASTESGSMMLQTEPVPIQQPELSPLDSAMSTLCPITRYKDKTLGDLIRIDPRALAYVAKSGDKYGIEVANYAQLICEDALLKVSA